MDKTRLLFIANPISGTHDKQPIIDSLPRSFQRNVLRGRSSGRRTVVTRRSWPNKPRKEGMDVCVAIGGDGTVNEVARSLCHSQTALAIIPMGSGNGLARHIQIPMDPDGALHVLSQCQIKALDYGTINDIPFFCTCGVGFDAFISEKFAGSGKRGLMTYIENTLKGGLTYQPDTYELEIDGQTEHHKAFLIACGNASQYGNNFYITPQASMSDGLLDVTIMEPFNVLEAPQIVMQMLNKTLDTNPRIRTFRCRSLKIHRPASGVIHYDGEPAEAGTDLTVQLVPNGLRVVVNAEANRNATPMMHIFQDLYDQITGDIKSQQRKILAINKSFLDHIRQQALNFKL